MSRRGDIRVALKTALAAITSPAVKAVHYYRPAPEAFTAGHLYFLEDSESVDPLTLGRSARNATLTFQVGYIVAINGAADTAAAGAADALDAMADAIHAKLETDETLGCASSWAVSAHVTNIETNRVIADVGYAELRITIAAGYHRD